MNHNQIRKLLDHNKPHPPHLQTAIDDHLSSCEECRAYAQMIRDLSRGNWGVYEAKSLSRPQLHVLSHSLNQAVSRPNYRSWLPAFSINSLGLAVGAVGMLVFVLTTWLVQPNGSQPVELGMETATPTATIITSATPEPTATSEPTATVAAVAATVAPEPTATPTLEPTLIPTTYDALGIVDSLIDLMNGDSAESTRPLFGESIYLVGQTNTETLDTVGTTDTQQHPDNLSQRIALFQALNTRFTTSACRVSDNGGAATVTCELSMDNDWRNVLELAPHHSVLRVRFNSLGQVVSIADTERAQEKLITPSCATLKSACPIRHLSEWLVATYPEQYASLVVPKDAKALVEGTTYRPEIVGLDARYPNSIADLARAAIWMDTFREEMLLEVEETEFAEEALVESVMAEFEAALNNGSAETLAKQFGPTVQYSTSKYNPSRYLSDIELADLLAQAGPFNSEFSITDCTSIDGGDHIDISCSMTMQNDWRRELGLDPLRSRITLMYCTEPQASYGFTNLQDEDQEVQDLDIIIPYITWYNDTFHGNSEDPLARIRYRIDVTNSITTNMDVYNQIDTWNKLGRPTRP